MKKEIKTLEAALTEQKKAWSENIEKLQSLSKLKVTLENLTFEQQKAEKEGNFEKASQLKYSQIPAIEAELNASSVSIDLDKEDVAGVLSRQTGVPAHKILASEQEKILKVEGFLKDSVYGQNDAIQKYLRH